MYIILSLRRKLVCAKILEIQKECHNDFEKIVEMVHNLPVPCLDWLIQSIISDPVIHPIDILHDCIQGMRIETSLLLYLFIISISILL